MKLPAAAILIGFLGLACAPNLYGSVFYESPLEGKRASWPALALRAPLTYSQFVADAELLAMFEARGSRIPADDAATRESAVEAGHSPLISVSPLRRQLENHVVFTEVPMPYRVPEPLSFTIWGVGAVALAAAHYRRSKRGGRTSPKVRAAVSKYLEECDPENAFRSLSQCIVHFCADPNWSSQEIEEFYDEVVIALHERQQQAAA